MTVEIVLWVLVAVVALVVRLVNLDAAPLAAHEAREATLAWRAATGQGMPDADYIPFLFAANALSFALCGAGDALARLWPALLGSAFVLTPLLFRHRVGRVGVLMAGLYLAISPTAIFASRQLGGAIVAACGGAVFFGGGLRFIETRNRTWLLLGAVGLALAVASSPSVYGMMLALGLAWLGFAWGWPIGRLRWLWRRVQPHLRCMAGVFLLAVLAFATGLGWNPGGVGVAADLLASWLSRFGMVSLLPLAILVVYEPLALLAGLIGLVWFIWKKRRFGLLLGLWVCVALPLLVTAPPQTPVGVVWVILPLALLGGVAVEAVAQSRQALRRWRSEWVYAFVVLALWVYLYLRFARYGFYGEPLDLVVGVLAFVSPLVLLALAAIIFALLSGDDRKIMGEIIGGAKGALRGAVLGTGVALLAATFSMGWGCAHVRPADPRELLVHQPTAVEVRDLVQTLRDLSWRETAFPTTLRFTYEAPCDSALAWYLRDFGSAQRVDDLQELEPWEWGGVVVTLDREWALGLPEGGELVGRDFALSRSWDVHNLACALEWPPCDEAVEWLIHRAPAFTAQKAGAGFALEPKVDQWAVIWRYSSNSQAEEISHSQ
jgi:uncharacterized protein (TIGR03663 family)